MPERKEERKTSSVSGGSSGTVWLSAPTRSEVKKMIKRTGIPVASIAHKLGMRRQTLDYQLKGDEHISIELFNRIQAAIEKMRSAYGHGTENLNAEDTGRNLLQNNSDSGNFKDYGDQVEFGRGGMYPILKKFIFKNGELDMSKENVAGYAFYPQAGKEDFFSVINHGDHMKAKEGKSIDDQYFAFVDLKEKIVSGDFVLVHLKGNRDLLRQVIFAPDGHVTLRSINDKYPDIILKEEEIEYIGRIVASHPPFTYH